MGSFDKIGAFRFLTGDVNPLDYGGKWYRRITDTRYHVIALDNWINLVGERDAREVGARYNVTLREIDLTIVDVASALRSCGYVMAKNGDVEQPHDGTTIAKYGSETWPLVLIECCHGHGAAAPISDENGDNWRNLFRAAARESRLLDDPAEHARAMARPVNRIGSTAAEYAAGDIRSAILRGEAAGDASALLIGKVYRNCGGRTLGGEIVDLGPAPEGADRG
jgi:hypothetical protein